MKKLLLIGLAATLLTGCSVMQTHTIDEEGYVSFINTMDLSTDMEEQENPEEQKSKIPEYCENSFLEWDEDITSRGCKGDENGIITQSGKYKINSTNFIKKDGYILFNAKEINNAKDKLSDGNKKYSPVIGDADKAAKAGTEDIYSFVLPGEPVNYVKGLRLNSFMIFNDKDYFFVSKIGEGENPFQDKLTEENSRNIESLYYFPETPSQEEKVNNIDNKLFENSQKEEEIRELEKLLGKEFNEGETTSHNFSYTFTEKDRQIEEEREIEGSHSSGQMLSSTGSETVIQKLLNSIMHFFSKLF